jgi:hypothetical protein
MIMMRPGPLQVQLEVELPLVNFNFELLAPECSVSLNFEAKL